MTQAVHTSNNGHNLDVNGKYTAWLTQRPTPHTASWRDHEAPWTYTAKWRDDSGLEQFVCARADTLAELIPSIRTITEAARKGMDPQHAEPPAPTLKPEPQPHAGETREDWCALHRVALDRHTGKTGHSWYSHWTPQGWCKGKER
jgi:hypothetical protein